MFRLPLLLKFSPHVLIWWIGSYTPILLVATNWAEVEFIVWTDHKGNLMSVWPKYT